MAISWHTFVILSEAKDLPRWAEMLRITRMTGTKTTQHLLDSRILTRLPEKNPVVKKRFGRNTMTTWDLPASRSARATPALPVIYLLISLRAQMASCPAVRKPRRAPLSGETGGSLLLSGLLLS